MQNQVELAAIWGSKMWMALVVWVAAYARAIQPGSFELNFVNPKYTLLSIVDCK